MRIRFGAAIGWGLCILVAGTNGVAAEAVAAPFDVSERSILELQQAQADGRTSARGLTEAYLARIEAYDHARPALNAIVTLNPHALEEAEALDRERRSGVLRGPLHGIPVLVKDNYDTIDMPTSGGSLGLATLRPVDDAFQVKRLRQAGAIILGKTTMHEFAAGITTESSLTGFTRNPYDLARLPGGSSGGSAVAVAASFAAAALGSDTSGSIRLPAALQNLVGFRVTRGLSSRGGIMPLSSSQDVAGPLARSVTDLAIVLDATVGYDPQDATTSAGRNHVPKSYRDALTPKALNGARIGIVSAFFGKESEEEEIGRTVREALDAMKGQGAQLVEVRIPHLEDLLEDSSTILYEFKFELADYLQSHGAPVTSLTEILDRGLYSERMDERLRARNAPQTRDSPDYRATLARRKELRSRVMKLLQSHRLDALAYPTLNRNPALIGEPQQGSAAAQLSASTGLPALSMPAGFTQDGLPIGMELLGAEFSEARLLALAYAWEQLAKPRKAPFSTPPLIDGRAPPPLDFVASVTSSQSNGATARVRFSFDTTTSMLAFDAAVTGLGTDQVIALTLQRGTADKPGPIVAHLLRAGEGSETSKLTLNARLRDDLAAGRIFLHFYTRQAPLGVGRSVLRLPENR